VAQLAHVDVPAEAQPAIAYLDRLYKVTENFYKKKKVDNDVKNEFLKFKALHIVEECKKTDGRCW
jgi:hypothetical protein